MIQENDTIIAVKKINDQIEEGYIGVVLSVYESGTAYLVEFFDTDSKRIGNGMETVKPGDIELVFSK